MKDIPTLCHSVINQLLTYFSDSRSTEGRPVSEFNVSKKLLPEEKISTKKKALFLQKVSIFESIPSEVLLLIAEFVVASQVKANTEIFHEGEEGDSFYMLASGCVVIKNSQGLEVEISPNGFFGEKSILDNKPRFATATAKTDIVLFQIYKQEFIQLVEDVPAFAYVVIHRVLVYLRDSQVGRMG